MKKINIKIDNKKITCAEGETVMSAAKRSGVEIPGFCGHPDFPPKGNCGVCVVEIKGRNKLAKSCHTPVVEGMEIFTDSPRVRRSRNLNIELIFAEHIEKCGTCVWRIGCKLLRYADKYGVKITRFKDRKGSRKIYKFANAVELDGTQCIDCRNCVDACSKMQKIDYLEIAGKGAEQEIIPTKDKEIDCIYCGQCSVHCPVGSAQEQTSWEAVEKVLRDPGKVAVAQFAPSARVSIGEEFGMDCGKVATGQLVASLRELGFDYVFDVNFGADITTMVEAEELLERISVPSLDRVGRGGGPMFTSCCPAWVKWAEFYRPDLIPNLTTARSPHIHLGGIVRTYWAEKEKIKPKDITVVSIMPCTAKKFEAARPELKVNGLAAVDYVLTVRELAWMLKKHNIEFAKLKKQNPDNPLRAGSGAAVIYGASGGVMESALRTAQVMACKGKSGDLCEARLEFDEVRGQEGIKEAVVKIGKKNLRAAVVNGIGNIRGVLDNLDKYDYIEVMACPGGCAGGGGQPIPTDREIVKKRIEALYALDKGEKIRKAHENEDALEAINWLNKNGELGHKVLHTKYKSRK